MTDRKMITKQQYNQGLLDFFFRDGSNAPKWDDLQDAPKHTDEDYEEIVKLLGIRNRDFDCFQKRIKELEAEIDRLRHAVDWLFMARDRIDDTITFLERDGLKETKK